MWEYLYMLSWIGESGYFLFHNIFGVLLFMTFMYSAFIDQFKFAIVLKEVTDNMKGNGGYTRNFHLRQTVQKDSLVHKSLNVLKCVLWAYLN